MESAEGVEAETNEVDDEEELLVDDAGIEYWTYCDNRIKAMPANTKNGNYISNYKRYVNWVQLAVNDIILNVEVEEHPISKGLIFITQQNVEQYFVNAVVNYNGLKSSIRNILNSLKHFRTYYEYPLGESIIETPIISHSITQQQFNASQSTKHRDSDPHNCIKDIMSKNDIIKIILTIYTHRNDSLDLAFSFLWGINGGVRGSSSRAFNLSDLYVSEGYGPEDHPPRNKTLMLILRKGKIHKDKHTTCRLVGVHRHRDYRLCTVFATGLLVIDLLRSDSAIQFLKPPKDRALWWDVPINKYKDYISQSNAMRDVLKVADVKSTKVTHHRYQAVQFAGANGLTMEQVSTITKHITSRLNSSYQPEVEIECLKVMSGFRKHEERFVKEEHICIDNYKTSRCDSYFELALRSLIPKYDTFVAQTLSRGGDKSDCAHNFLKDIVPYLVSVVVQNGIYFVNEFPNHFFFNILRDIPEYERFIVFQKHEVNDFVMSRLPEERAQIESLSKNICVVIGSVEENMRHNFEETNNRIDVAIQQINVLKKEVVELKVGILQQIQQNNEIIINQQILSQQIHELGQRIPQKTHETNIEETHPIHNMVNNDNGMNIDSNISTSAIVLPTTVLTVTETNVATDDVIVGSDTNTGLQINNVLTTVGIGHNRANVRGDATSQLRSRPRQPSIRPKCPKFWKHILEEWQREDHGSFERDVNKKDWDSEIQARFAKRCRVIRQIRRVSNSMNKSMDEAAEALDVEHKVHFKHLSFTEHLERTEENDTTIKRRTPKMSRKRGRVN